MVILSKYIQSSKEKKKGNLFFHIMYFICLCVEEEEEKEGEWGGEIEPSLTPRPRDLRFTEALSRATNLTPLSRQAAEQAPHHQVGSVF